MLHARQQVIDPPQPEDSLRSREQQELPRPLPPQQSREQQDSLKAPKPMESEPPKLSPERQGREHQRPDSPVFKGKRTSPPPLLQQSDALFEIWQAFLVSRKAHAGDPIAQHELGVRYMLGRGIEADTVKAAHWFHEASQHNMLSSRFNLGILWYHGWGLSWDPFESYKAFLSCAEAGMNEAQYVVGLTYTEDLVVPRDYDQAVAWVRKAAEAGYAPAKETLPDLEKAAARQHAQEREPEDPSPFSMRGFDDLEEDSASEHATEALVKSVLLGGDPELRRALGLSQMLDEEVAIDSLRLQGIEAAAASGSPEALAVLGRNKEKGIGGGRDVVQACAHYIRALRMDWPRAARLLWSLAHEQGVVAEIRGRARRGDVDAQFVWAALLGLGFESLLFKEQALLTPAQAIQFLQKGAEQGDVSSMNELALCYFSGRWVVQDQKQALELWARARDRGSKEAEIRMAVVDVQHPGDSLRVAGAVAVLEQAATDGSILAEVALAYCYEHGVGVPVRLGEAVRLYRLGARRGSQDAYRALRRLHDDLRPQEERFLIEEG
jgi:hypothetical protein